MDTPSDMSLTPSTPNLNPAQAVASLSAESSSSNLFQNAAGFNIIGGQFVAGDFHNHPVKAIPGVGPLIPSADIMDETYSECEIYCNQLLRRRRGFPLHVPEPQENLPPEYREHGVQIGDVGRITPEGIFDFFFNIYLPADHPVNDNDVPEDFCPLPHYESKDIVVLNHPPGNYVSTSSIRQVALPTPFDDEFPGAGFLFNCGAPQGAVLALPHGARLRKLETLEILRDYVATHAENWYRYIMGARGRRLANGSLYLVTGCEKAHSWGMATFHSVSEEFQLTFKPAPRADSTVRYRWSGAHGCPDPSQHKEYDPSSTNAPLNQTTFIHGLSISLGVGIWGKLFGKVGISDIAESQLGSAGDNGRASHPQSSSFFSSVLGFFEGGGSTSGTSHAGDHPPNKGGEEHVERPENAFMLFRRSLLAPTPGDSGSSSAHSPPLLTNAQGTRDAAQQWTVLSPEERAHWEALAAEKKREHEILYPNYTYRSRRTENVVLSDLPPIVKIFHPAEIINTYILAKTPEATVVMSHDDDWRDILAENPSMGLKIQTVSEFLYRLNNEFSIKEKDGATFL
ncbi:hypothetical protein B0H16DRAFT_50810 [Mycena metata]|uniref:HMG box domain-containing protein n=1 Tax=Mycena metata TaxID=1033252 RepID=A0AAD7N162_9AGAR|nr:hypothetical protein B0H16DRAFT_50810 [Mycena metata]